MLTQQISLWSLKKDYSSVFFEMPKVSLLTKFLIFPLFVLPRPVKRLLSHGLARFWFHVLKIRRAETEARVAMVMGHLSKKEQQQIVYRSFYNLILVLFEYSYFPFCSRQIFKHCQLKGTEKLQGAIDEGKGVFIVAGHVGNGEMGIYRTCLEGFPLYLIAKRVGVDFIDKTLFGIREVSGLVHLPPKKCGDEIIKALKKGLPIVYLIDQFSYPPKGVPTTFMGAPTYTNASLAYLAIKSGAVVIEANVHRGKKDLSILEFGDRIETETPYDSIEKNVVHMTQKYNSAIEKYVYKYPGDWMWIHRRWKRQPSTEDLKDFKITSDKCNLGLSDPLKPTV